MRLINEDFENDYKEGANFIAEFVRLIYYDKLSEIDMQEVGFLPSDLKDVAGDNMWKRIQKDLIQSFEHMRVSNLDYNFTVNTIIDEVKSIINNPNIPEREKGDNVFTWIVFYTMTLFVKDDRLKRYKRKPYVQIDRSKDYKEQVFSNIVLGEEYSDQMCSCLGVYEAARLLNMEYLIPIVEVSTSVCVWAKALLARKNRENKKLRNIPNELDTEKAKGIFIKTISSGLCDSSYRWNGTIQLLAYFADKMSHYLNLTQRTDKDGNIVTSWKPFEILFDYEGKEQGKGKLKGAKQNWMRLNTKFEPTGFEKVDALFE
ncbi:hypothetical protein [Bacteroides faecis]|uniref:Uncharacterized protein n=1 Tax=Bacteroides faecis TaxID=674529 RepID=A0ABY5T756_9BACE|nr:hypothetical protein [Bacteroides faecis]KAA5262270.1 hypothetical protein F2Z43_11760 [Bacteroides faecis]KAA5292377.1 hypothetical protein F2Z11_08960 [Bacteroides faecis]KAA5299871.1 hypothetical protein F2Z35_10505 [Bacteroides faecis]UVQ73694.1 hypothetical protein NXY30_22210 [Bacteroides faecis]